jgi:phage shock protein PspC (stress-responsive transcriptional regulator)
MNNISPSPVKKQGGVDMKRLYRSRDYRIIAGVCGGIGEYFGIDPVLIRIITIMLVIFGGGGLVAYLLAIIIIPLEPILESPVKEPDVSAIKSKIKEPLPEEPDRIASFKKHISFLGVLYIIFNTLTLVIALIVFAAVAGGGFITGDETVIAITTTVASIVAGFLFIFSAPGIICGLGLLKFRSWSRTLALVLGIVNLINIPFGTALGIYTLWVMMQEETEDLFKEYQT